MIRIKYILCILLVCLFLPVYSQIGVYTENIEPEILLHIDAAKNNTAVGTVTANELLDDLVITKTGNIGLGTNSPTTKFHIITGGTAASPNPQVIIQDGNEVVNKVLQSDSKGLGKWVTYAPGAVLGNFDSNGINISGNATGYYNSKSYITLPPGKWCIIFTLVIANTFVGVSPLPGARIVVKASLSDDASSSTISGDIISNDLFSNSILIGKKGAITGHSIINNTSSHDKNYYLIVGGIEDGNSNITITNVGKNTGESSFFAFRVKE